MRDIDQSTTRLFWRRGIKDVGAGYKFNVDWVRDFAEGHTLFYRASIMASGYDLLAWVAAFGKTHSTDQLEIQRLGDKQVLSSGFNPRHTQLNILTCPLFRRRQAKIQLQCSDCRLIRRTSDPPPTAKQSSRLMVLGKNWCGDPSSCRCVNGFPDSLRQGVTGLAPEPWMMA